MVEVSGRVLVSPVSTSDGGPHAPLSFTPPNALPTSLAPFATTWVSHLCASSAAGSGAYKANACLPGKADIRYPSPLHRPLEGAALRGALCGGMHRRKRFDIKGKV